HVSHRPLHSFPTRRSSDLTVSKNVSLPAGVHVLRVTFDGAASNGQVAGLDYIKVSPASQTLTLGTSTSAYVRGGTYAGTNFGSRSEEHTSELQSQSNLVCR